ncbi:paired domain-containing protein [Trichonephila clavipes]|nr:paired domain-containing protein [Trichonephila clavipes]
MSSKRSAILESFQQGKQQCEIVRLLNVSRQTVSICRFKELGNHGRHPGSGCKSTENTSRNRKAISKNSTPAYKAKTPQEWCKANFPDIPSEEWPPYTPDFNPMDYSV